MAPLRTPAGLATFATPTFSLRDDVDALRRVLEVGAHEAALFYCGRIVETTASAVLERAGCRPTSNLLANLDTLLVLTLLPRPMAYWAHAVRRIGNDARHVRRRVAAADAEVAVVLLERWLAWCHGTLGEAGASEDDATTSGALAGVVRELERADLDAARVVALVAGADVTVAASTLPAVAAEMLIDRRRYDEAARVLDLARERFPSDLRLRQLAALRWSRLGEAARAIELLEPLRHDGDEETAGILGGAYKRQWLDDRSDGRLLALAERRYRDGWERSRNSSPYLGINAATLALVQGRPDDAREIAATVRALLERRHADIVRVRKDPHSHLDAWDEGTLGEAALVLGDIAAATSHYRAAVGLAAVGQIEVMAAQATLVLAHCGSPAQWADLVGGA